MQKMMILAAALAWPTVAMADDIPGDRTTGAVLAVTGSGRTPGVLDSAADSDWYRVQLLAGRDYAVGASAIGADIRLRDPNGGVLASGLANESESGGLEVRAPFDGTYFVEVAGSSDGRYPQDYRVGISPDCQGDVGTLCKIKPGASRAAITAWSGDVDWYKATLSAAGSYDLTLDVPSGVAHLIEIADQNGNPITYAEAHKPILGFRPPKDGSYFIEVVPQDNDGARYTLNLSSGVTARHHH